MEQQLARSKDKSGEEFWRGKCRELQKRVNQLEKQLTRYQRTQHLIDEAHETLMEVEQAMAELQPSKPERVDPCDKCEHGEMILKFDYPELNKKIYQCIGCGCTRSKLG